MMNTLTDTEILTQLPNQWEYDTVAKSIIREFDRGNFVEAVEFIRRIVPLAEALDHHPDLLLHDYKMVRVMLSTHSEGGVTKKDLELATQIDGLS